MIICILHITIISALQITWLEYLLTQSGQLSNWLCIAEGQALPCFINQGWHIQTPFRDVLFQKYALPQQHKQQNSKRPNLTNTTTTQFCARTPVINNIGKTKRRWHSKRRQNIILLAGPLTLYMGAVRFFMYPKKGLLTICIVSNI